MNDALRAEVAELADAHDSGSCARKGVGVRVPPSAPSDLMGSLAFSQLTPERVARLARTIADLHVLMSGVPVSVASTRPASAAWSATEIVCHLRDIEEAYLDRMKFILVNADPVLVQFNPERWCDDRQYRCQDTGVAIATFGTRRAETLQFVNGLAPDDWERCGHHPSRGPLSVRKIIHSLAKHDAEHLEQMKRALAGAP